MTTIKWTAELRALETEIGRGRKDRRINSIREALAIYLKSLEMPWWKRWLNTR